jgi:transcriptional regulator with XRE-family HTH domain
MTAPTVRQGSAAGFGDLLRAYRCRAGLTQQQMADFATLSVRAVRDLERGRAQHPRRDTVRLLSEALRLDARDRAAFRTAAGTDADAGWAGEAIAAGAPPAPEGALVGRSAQVSVLRELLTVDRQRLVDVVGIGGAGKTRLVNHVANDLHATLGWPVVWTTGALDPAAEAELAARVGDRDALLVLDGSADDRPAVLDRCRGLRAVLIGRSPRRLPGEQVLPVGPLAVPDHGASVDAVRANPAARLLVSHIRRARPEFGLGPATAAAVTALCRALDGLPGPLELAGIWCLVHRPQALAELVAHDPFVLCAPLTAVRAPTDLRRSLSAAVELLAPPHRVALTRLARLPGDWSIPQAAPLAGGTVLEAAATIHTLLVHGLVRTEPGAGAERFRVLNLVRSLHLSQTEAKPNSHRKCEEKPQ